MLDAATKRRIDTARDILVGKVPDPKSQVEQITIALIYKFMDDIDAASEELGGERQFFAGDFARYGWPRLVRSGLGGHETLNLYAEAITRMPENPGIPALFRDIFKNAYLPYRDPETLRAFLKIIDEFEYDHSERLGDAFEYLLSVLGSQGDAGQFRTPRHIIDFMVAIIDPKKDETVLDPACGTAGFLISSYKHIRNANTDDEGNSTLTPDEKGKLAGNFKGYDISPDMVRLSLVNMYLHGFVDPHIFEYDTLTSEERWNEYADVILANPPFMSPKGGIRPHNRFSMKSKRSEVLFVDYMAEHLNPSGRAAIIVPEGIIFQSQTAHKSLRKMLVENYLVAVVSLPAGVFQPYSGVKTSFLLLDKALAKKTDCIAFFKVENDGYDLGTQRRPIEKNDLPRVQTEISEYLSGLRESKPVPTNGVAEPKVEYATGKFRPTLGLIAEKEKIAAGGEYSLSGERYRERETLNTVYELVPVGRFLRAKVKSTDPRKTPDEIFELWSIPAYGTGTPELLQGSEIGSSKKVVYPGDILLSRIIPHIRRAWVVKENLDKRCQIASTEWIVFSSPEVIPEYLRHILISDPFHVRFMQTITGVGGSLSRANPSAVADIQIPLPPLEVQREMISKIEGYQRVIDGARAVIDNYRPQIVVDPEWPMVELGDICKLISGQHIDKSNYNMDASGIGYLTGPADFGGTYASVSKWTTKPKVLAEKGDILITVKGSGLGKINFLNIEKVAISRQLMAIRVHDAVPEFIYNNLIRMYDHIQKLGGGAAIPGITRDDVLKLAIPLPTMEVQHTIVAEIEAEQALVDANQELIERFEKKIQDAMGRVWSEGNSVLTMTKAGND